MRLRENPRSGTDSSLYSAGQGKCTLGADRCWFPEGSCLGKDWIWRSRKVNVWVTTHSLNSATLVLRISIFMILMSQPHILNPSKTGSAPLHWQQPSGTQTCSLSHTVLLPLGSHPCPNWSFLTPGKRAPAPSQSGRGCWHPINKPIREPAPITGGLWHLRGYLLLLTQVRLGKDGYKKQPLQSHWKQLDSLTLN